MKHRRWICFLTIAVGFLICAQAQQTGSWGDQGDGTYRNPVLNADYPDVDVERVGDTYFMISSKQHMSPGMVILESKDMVNWTTIGHVWDRLSWAPEYNWNEMRGYRFGVWAGDLAYHDGTWYCYQIDSRHGLYMSSATDIRGPWTQPIQMLTNEKIFDDPVVFWDEKEHQAYLLCNTAKKQKRPENTTPGSENRLYKMSWDGREIQDSGKVIYTGPGAEAAKIYNINDTWYIFMAEWFVGDKETPLGRPSKKNDRKQLVLRSQTDSIYGPYEKKVVFERGNGFERSCSQGALMQAPDGSWWYMHQLIQNIGNPFQGRPQCLQPVKWVDGWPMIGKDIDGDGIGEPVRSHEKPINGFPVTAPPTDDEFNPGRLGVQWEWNHNPRDSHWTLAERPGWLRLKADRPVAPVKNYRIHGQLFWRAFNTVSQRIMGTSTGSAVARFDLSGMKAGQRAGFVRFGGIFHLLGVHVEENDTRRLFFMDMNGKELRGDAIHGNDLFIRTTNKGDRAAFEFSTDGERFTRFGPEFTIAFGFWSGDRLGFFCWNESGENGHVDIDYFHYDYDGPKQELKGAEKNGCLNDALR
ncbi:glycoside hydrolase family 43 protein [Pontiella desulfatans]